VGICERAPFAALARSASRHQKRLAGRFSDTGRASPSCPAKHKCVTVPGAAVDFPSQTPGALLKVLSSNLGLRGLTAILGASDLWSHDEIMLAAQIDASL
jgi:hypothetical protein